MCGTSASRQGWRQGSRSKTLVRMRIALLSLLALTVAGPADAQDSAASAQFKLEEVMVPVRDGVHLQTVILTPVDQSGPLPILFRRTPYGVPDKPPHEDSATHQGAGAGRLHLRDPEPPRPLQVRGRVQALAPTSICPTPTATNETTDAYDSIEWLVQHMPNNNGKVGMYGVSYDGLTTAMALLKPHPALKAMSEQASPVDQWMNDDMHRYGALRESYAFEYAVLSRRTRTRTPTSTSTSTTPIAWYLAARPAVQRQCQVPARTAFPTGTTSSRTPTTTSSGRRGLDPPAPSSTVPNLNVAGFWDQEDPWGPWQIFRHAERARP